ncbi:nicastrin-like [Haliotis rubra]|uniref:nicastrin-like n=1 Tax=Haliotis rubra TaxID=36100 RepID=UPI001EE6059E|nr:nicastrin-like [Haliotis rubra]
MANLARKWIVLSVELIFVSFLLLSYTDAKRTKEKIYIDLQTQNACFRSLNATHQIGCTSSSEGNVGVLHYLETQDDYNWILKDGPNPPYVVLMNSLEFNSSNLDLLVASQRVNGILVINVLENQTLTPFPGQFSADKSCPNDAYGMYHKDKSYSNCKKQKWNVGGTDIGMMFKDYSIPMFSLPNEDDVSKLINMCYEKFNRPINGVPRNYPLCAVQLNDRMDAAKDTVTCTRRTNRLTNLSNPVRYCDPLGDKNIVATMKTVNSTEERPEKSVIVFATKMDSLAMFHNEYPASDSTVTGIVTLLAVAEALGAVKDEIQNNSTAKDIMFTFFQGESFDYIGSSRMVYDMDSNSSQFPQDIKKDVVSLQEIRLENIHSFLEVNQVGLRDQGKLWIHTDPITRPKLEDPTQLSDMISSLKSIGSSLGVQLDNVTDDTPLPPASVQRFLMKANIPAIVLTDHQKEYTNRFFNSRFDLPAMINVTDHGNQSDPSADTQTQSLTDIATTLAHFLYTLSTGNTAPSSLKADKDIVECLLQKLSFHAYIYMMLVLTERVSLLVQVECLLQKLSFHAYIYMMWSLLQKLSFHAYIYMMLVLTERVSGGESPPVFPLIHDSALSCSSSIDPDDATVWVRHLVSSHHVSADWIISASGKKAKKPFPFYVSVNVNTNQVTTLTHHILAQYLGEEIGVTKDACKAPDKDKTHQFLWIQGNLTQPSTGNSRVGACIKSTSMLTLAKSPAFDIDDYDWLSGTYSTWTESVWEPLKVRIFLVPSQQFQVLTLCVGIAILLVSMIVVYFINGSADVIFNTGSSQTPQS